MTGAPVLQALREATAREELVRRVGRVRGLVGLGIESEGPDAALGEICSIQVEGTHPPINAEVVGLRPGIVSLMPYGSVRGLSTGNRVVAMGTAASIGVGDALLGRVIDGFGEPLDGLEAPRLARSRNVRAQPLNPMDRPPIHRVLETGVRSIDALLTLGQGQRVGIFAGSGVGKSTLLGMMARHVKADVNVIALIGERGREVRDFVQKQLGQDGLARSVVVVATSDQPALGRLRAAYAAMAIAEDFRDRGKQVLLTMDSITRFAMARREVGLAAGEPPTARGYTPSVFAEIPELCERCGTHDSGGSITALLTVLVEGDDFNEPVSDCLRATLDGHIVLSRAIAQRGHYPAIDILQSTSRLMTDLAESSQRAHAVAVVKMLSILDRNRQMVDIGAYQRGGNAELDRALELEPQLMSFLAQANEATSLQETLHLLSRIIGAST